MEILESVLFGLLQGVTEFLPVSSSGHLALFNILFDYSPEGGFLSRVVAVHFATLVAVVIAFRRDIVRLFTADRKVLLLIVVGTIPAGILGYLSRDFFEGVSSRPLLVGLGFIASAFFLLLGGKYSSGAKGLGDLTMADSIVVGLAQALAIIPGVSRSGSTISVGQWRGASGESAASFAFLLMIPAVGGAVLLDAKELFGAGVRGCAIDVAVAFVCALASGVVALKFLLRLLEKGKFSHFVYYLMPLGAVVVLYGLFR